jgi:hypothetical protein
MPQLDGLLRYSGVPFAGGKIEHHPHVPTSTLRAQKTTVLGHINKDHVIPELQLLERLHRLMVAAETMDGELRLAAGSRVTNGFRGLAAVRQGPTHRLKKKYICPPEFRRKA